MMILCSSLGMFLSANLPLTIELDRTGSVGVTHAAIANECRKLRLGTNPQMMNPLHSHIAVMPGPRRSARLLHSRYRYLLGSCTPASTNCTPSTSRVKYNVILARFSGDPPAYSKGLTKFVAWGEKRIPAKKDITFRLFN